MMRKLIIKTVVVWIIAAALGCFLGKQMANACTFGDYPGFLDRFAELMYQDLIEEAIAEQETLENAQPDDLLEPPEEDDSDYDYMEYMGEYELTFYNDYGAMASGNTTYYGAVASNYLPRGTMIYIEGWGEFKVEDCGGSALTERVLDVWVPWSTQECLEKGRVIADVYRICRE